MTFWDDELTRTNPYGDDEPDEATHWARWEEFATESNRLSWGLLDTFDNAWVLASSGVAIPIDPICIIGMLGHEQIVNYYTHLDIGTLGTGLLDSKSMTVLTPRESVDRNFGPFAYCPILVDSKKLERGLFEIESRIKLDNGVQPDDYKTDQQIKDGIVRSYLNGMRLTKSEYKSKFAPDVKHEAFREIWSQAVKEIPELARPGPKPSTHQMPNFRNSE
tara:strand:+ start:167 stop:823 length:657 start_codon:yes stop_codon:yes gene_type:complete